MAGHQSAQGGSQVWGSVSLTDNLLTVRLDEATATLSYYGRADAGALTGAAVWQIKRIDTSAGVVIDWADGNTDFDNVWDNRAALSYR